MREHYATVLGAIYSEAGLERIEPAAMSGGPGGEAPGPPQAPMTGAQTGAPAPGTCATSTSIPYSRRSSAGVTVSAGGHRR